MTHPIIIPAFLKTGDTVGVVAPASKVRYEDCIPGLEVLRQRWQLNVIEGATLQGEYNQFSGTDEQRTFDLQAMLDNPDLKAIIAVRGGYGCSRIMDQLDYTKFRQSPKWLVGFSDLTALLSQLYTMGFTSIHGPMTKLFTIEQGETALESLRKCLFGESVGYHIPVHSFNRTGQATGQVIGGNLCLFAHLNGSKTEIDTAGKILFIEDINEYLYTIDRLIIQLKRAGQLKSLAGLIVGQFTDVRDNPSPPFGKTAYEIILEHTQEFNYPICFDFPVGHVADNRALFVGIEANLRVTPTSVELNYHQTLLT
jgi:muramoyltetrapeptide carboxypeptidase